MCVSIHAPTRGATTYVREPIPPAVAVSIHAPTRGATFRRARDVVTILGFNSRTHAGCDDGPYWDF